MGKGMKAGKKPKNRQGGMGGGKDMQKQLRQRGSTPSHCIHNERRKRKCSNKQSGSQAVREG